VSEWMVKSQIPWHSFIVYVEIAETGVFEGIDRGVVAECCYNTYPARHNHVRSMGYVPTNANYSKI